MPWYLIIIVNGLNNIQQNAKSILTYRYLHSVSMPILLTSHFYSLCLPSSPSPLVFFYENFYFLVNPISRANFSFSFLRIFNFYCIDLISRVNFSSTSSYSSSLPRYNTFSCYNFFMIFLFSSILVLCFGSISITLFLVLFLLSDNFNL